MNIIYNRSFFPQMLDIGTHVSISLFSQLKVGLIPVVAGLDKWLSFDVSQVNNFDFDSTNSSQEF